MSMTTREKHASVFGSMIGGFIGTLLGLLSAHSGDWLIGICLAGIFLPMIACAMFDVID